MKSLLKQISILLFSLFTFVIKVNSQTYSTTIGSSSFTSGGSVCKNVVVSGLSGNLNHDLGLQSVVLNINHPNMAKINVTIKSPDNTTFTIVYGAYGTYTGANFTNTVITQINSPLSLNSGTAPFTGNFRTSDLSFDFCNVNNNARTGNGTWQICVTSALSGGAGTFVDASLIFGVNAPSEYGTGIAGESPALAPYKCDISSYSGWTSDCYDGADTTGTNLGSTSVVPFAINNDSWLKLIPQGSTMNITFTVKNCKKSGASSGLQLVVLDALNSGLTQFREIPTSSGINPYVAGTYSESISGLAPGSPVYLMFDGYAGDVCEYDVISYNYSGSSTLLAQANPAAICSGSGLSSQITTINIPTASYVWTPTAGLSASNIYNPIATPTVSTSYIVTANDPVSGCIFKDTVDIVVNTLPTINAGNDVAICAGTSTSLSAISPAIVSAGIVEFTNITDVPIPDNSVTGGSSTIAVSGITPSTYSTARINKVCMNIDHPDIHDLSVQLTSPGGSSISLKNYSTIGTSGYGPDFINACFVVSGGIALSYNSQGPLWTNYAPAGAFTGITSGSAVNGNWTLKVTDNYGGNIGTLSDWTLFFNTTSLYSWTPTTNLGTPSLATTSANPVSTTTYTATVKDGNGCNSNADNVEVTVSPTNTITLTSGLPSTAQSICLGSPISVITYTTSTATGATVSGLPIGVSGTWVANAITISGTPSAVGTYNYTITLTGGCGTVTSTGTITVNPSPTPTVASVTPFCLGGSATLSGIVGGAATIAKTFTNSSTYSIPEGGVTSSWTGTGSVFAQSDIAVSGLLAGWNFTSVSINTTYNYDGDLIAYLFNPCGDKIQLLKLNGGSGDNFTNTTFSPTASTLITSIVAAGAPFTNTYVPFGGATAFNTFITASKACASTNGTWSLKIGDNYADAGAGGRINSWTLNLTNTVAPTFSWSPTTNMTGPTTLTPTVTPTISGTTTYVLTETNYGNCSNTATVNVTAIALPVVPAISGTANVCVGSTTTLANTTSGGTWTSASTSVATINSSTGVLTGIAAGTSLITYTVTSGGCTTTVTATVNVYAMPIVANITGTLTVCPTVTTQLADATGGGVWSSASTGIATIDPSIGLIMGVSSGTSVISYAVTINGCTTTVNTSVTVNPLNTVVLSSAVGTDAQTLCINTPISSITYTTTGATGAGFSGLPTGVTGNWSANSITISGTPSTSGSLPYIITLTGGCGTMTTSGTINVTPINSINLSSAVGTDAQTVCINSAITAITYTTTGAIGATFSGLPSGVIGGFSANTVTISGTSSISGVFPYTITLTGGCGVVTKTGTLTVSPNNTILLTSALNTNAQTVCINTPIISITYSTTGATGASFSGLPSGVSGSWLGNTVTISGTPIVAANFSYIITLTGGCGTITENGTINITPVNSISLTSLVGSDAQTICNNSALTNITYSTTGATNASISGLPLGTSGVWSANTFTISGTPIAAGTFPYTITLIGGCGTITTTGTIVVTPINTVSLSSAVGTDGQTKCINSPITSITYATTGATGAIASGLPTGVSGNWLANVYTISGSASISGSFPYTVTLTGGCGLTTISGTLIITPNNTYTLSSALSTDDQTLCINTVITPITYTTVGATGATFSGLPTGVTGNWSANTITISGNPSVGGTFPYTATLTGGCGIVTINGTITITTVNTISLSSAVGTDGQTICLNTTLTSINYNTIGATGATVSGLPSGVSGNWLANVYTISGTPSQSGSFPYTVTLTGGCGVTTISGTINVTPDNTITLSSSIGSDNQTICNNTVLSSITYSTVGATGASFSGLPTGVSGSFSANTVTIIGTPTVSGTFNYTITLTGGCGSITKTGTINSTQDNTVTLTSAPNTDAQTVCVNNLLTDITYSTTGATGASFSGLPNGVIGNWLANQITITGTPIVAGNYPYTVTLSGGCGNVPVLGSGTIITGNTINLSSAISTDAQTICESTPLINITYTTTGATGANFSGLPAGISGNWLANTVTISGTPSVVGSFLYSVNLTGGCGVVSSTGTIQINPNNTIVLSSSSGTNAQSVCINSTIANITYASTSASGANFSGLPSGVNGIWSGNTVTISGTPSVSGNFTYTVSLTGGCGSITATGTIDVSPLNTVSLTSALATDNQTVCISNSVIPITYSTVGATGATFTGLPNGVTGNWNANVVTISGTPISAGTYTYIVNLTGGCGTISTTGTIIVSPTNTILFSSLVGSDNQTVCINTPITNITYTTSGATGANFSGLPVGVSGNWSGNVVTISGTTSIIGLFPYVITLTGGCGTITANGTITVNPSNTLVLTTALNSDAQVICITDALTSITYSTTGATGANFSGLPIGVNGSFSANTISISGTPTSVGVSNYTVTLIGGCSVVTSTGSVTVNAAPTLVITNPPSACMPATVDLTYPSVTTGSSLGTSLTYWIDAACTTTPLVGENAISVSATYYIKATIGTCFTKAPVTVAVNDCSCPVSLTLTNPAAVCEPGTVDLTTAFIETGGGTISYFMPDGTTPLVSPNAINTSGVYFIETVDISTCSDKKPVTVIIKPINTISLSSAAGTDNQTICLNTAVAQITYSTANATGASYSGLPNGVSGSFSSNTITISGTATSAGIYNYTVTLIGGCGALTSSGTITVTDNNSLTLSSVIGTNNSQLVCVSTPLTDITYATTGATGANFNNLPLGISGSLSSNVVTISGITSVIGVHNYSISFTGGCGMISAIGSFTIVPNNNVILSSAINTDAQTVYINTPITPITYSTTGATGATFSGLPIGVSGSWSGNSVSIFGTPSQSGVFNYTLTLTGGCGSIVSNGTITVLPLNTVSLTSALGTDVQTVCINSLITLIEYTTTGFTGASFVNLPLGVSGNFSANKVSITGTPTFSGTSNYTVNLIGGSGPSSVTGTINVTPLNTSNLVSAIGTDNQTKCINTPITSINYSTSGATGANFSVLPNGLTGSWNANSAQISGTSTLAGVYPYTITLTGGCGSIISNGTITISPDNTISMSSAAGTNAQSLCINTPITPITYVTTGATGSLVTGLPLGLTANLVSNTLTISGTPSQSGSFTYTVNLTGGCGNPTLTGTINVSPNNTIALSSALGSDIQSVCVNSPIVNITYTTTGATGANFSGLPLGVIGNWNSNLITISGSPSVVGTNTYSIILIGNCGLISVGGRIDVVSGNTLALTSAVNTDAQIICLNTALTNITYSTTGATGASFSGLPAGVSGLWAANTVTISGTPTVAGTYNFTVSTTGGCGVATLNGIITVNPNNTITLTSGVDSDRPTPCLNSAISVITYLTTDATGANFIGLPNGISGNWNNNQISISGTPISDGNFVYTINLTGGCGMISQTGTITVIPNNTVSLASSVGTDAQVICQNTALTNIVYDLNGESGVTLSGSLPTGVTGQWNAGNYTISGTPSVSGTFNYTLTLIGGCGIATINGSITVNPTNTINLSSSIGTNAQTICVNNAISNIIYSSTGASGVSASGLPTGINALFIGNNVVIAGTPLISGNFSYTVTLIGGCGTISSSGTLNVTGNNTITLTSLNGTDAQTICQNTLITPITYSTLGATNATISGLPAGVAGNWVNNTFTITGTPTVFGTFNYTISLVGGCGTITKTGSITINQENVFTLLSSTKDPVVCENNALSTIMFSTNTALNVNFSSLPAGLSGTFVGNTAIISGTPTIANNTPYNYTITAMGTCPGIPITGTITVNSVPTMNNIVFNNPVCEGTPITLNAISNAPLTWNNGITNNVSFNASVTTPYTVTANNGNCTTTQTVNVVVNPKPSKPIVTSSESYCKGEINIPLLNYIPTPSGVTGMTAVWYDANGNIMPNGAPAQNTSSVLTTHYSVAQMNLVSGCIGDTARINVTVKPSVAPKFLDADLSVCQFKPNPPLPMWTINNPIVQGTWTNVNTHVAGTVQTTFTPTNINGSCVSDTTITLEIHPLPIASFTASPEVFYNSNPTSSFQNNSTGAVNYVWDFGDNRYDSLSVNPTHTFPDSIFGEYLVTLTAISEFGCKSLTTKVVVEKEEVIYYIPNSFTPNNGDNLNNTFHPVFTSGIATDRFNFMIYNRWGVLVFKSSDPDFGWDGSYQGIDAMVGTYTWKVEFKESSTEIVNIKVGQLNLLR